MKIEVIRKRFEKRGYKVTRCFNGKITITEPNGFGKVFALYKAIGEKAGKITGTQPNERISRFYTPKELNVFIEGYFAGIQATTKNKQEVEL